MFNQNLITSREEVTTCPVCEEAIIDAIVSKPGQESILCEGPCQSWYHRLCAGLSKAAFAKISNLPDKFSCPQCRLATNEKEISSLKEKITALEICRLEKQEMELQSLRSLVTNLSNHLTLLSDELAEVKEQTKGLSTKQFENNSQTYASVTTSGQAKDSTTQISAPNLKPAHTSIPIKSQSNIPNDRKFNIIIFGMDEQTKGVPKHKRVLNDHSDASTILSTADPSTSIRDCFRFGPYKSDRKRPVLVKLTRSCDTTSILSKRNNLGISIKPDLSPEERKI